MTKKGRKKRGYTLIAVVLACIIYVGGFFLFKVTNLSTETADNFSEPFVSYLASKAESTHFALQKEAILFDSAEPIFLPTKWSTTKSKNTLTHIDFEQEDLLFQPLEPQIVLTGEDLFDCNEFSSSEITSALEIFDYDNNEALLRTFHESHKKSPSLKKRFGYLKITSMTDESLKKEQKIEETLELKADGNFWQPVEMRILIADNGTIGQPLMLNSSHHEAVDSAIKHYLSGNALELFGGLPQGYYKISIGP